jgi:hypothetical protein
VGLQVFGAGAVELVDCSGEPIGCLRQPIGALTFLGDFDLVSVGTQGLTREVHAGGGSQGRDH